VPRLLAEEDDAAGPGPISQAAGEEGQELYQAGAVEAEGFKGKFNQYLIRKVGGWLHQHPKKRGSRTAAADTYRLVLSCCQQHMDASK